MNEDKVREQFEAWMTGEGCHSSDLARVRDGYSNITLQMRYEAYRAAYDQARRDNQSNDLMAECMHMVHTDLIAAGVVGESVPPMMVPEAVMRAIGKARREALEEIEAIANELATGYEVAEIARSIIEGHST
ncbi:hypothetical protein [Schauerella aestuarii]|uniref:hypothetical protein n=1 Tax=Schauerella aestuarii TaxID=2511204 RepID=UPI00136ABA83|nr:hypothetical protein [Achromobacter aestuarii]MYZ41380.1 hypothetical protein [Achromobacter aestuarii]